MSLYSDYPAARARQIFADVVGAVTAIIVVAIALTVTAVIRQWGAFGRDLESAGRDFESGLTDAADNLGSVPLIGAGIRGPFDLAASAGESVAAAGRAQQSFVEAVAVGAGWSVALLPLVILTLVWIVPRVRFARRSARLRSQLAQGLTEDTLALRAVARAPLTQLMAVHPDPGAAWRTQDPAMLTAFAAIELRRAGIRASASR